MRLNRNRKLDRVLTPIYTSMVNIQEQEICSQLQIGKRGNVSLTSLPTQALVEEKSLAIYMAEKIGLYERNFNSKQKNETVNQVKSNLCSKLSSSSIKALLKKEQPLQQSKKHNNQTIIPLL